MKRNFLLYHWSPSRNRKSILKRGLMPGHRSHTKGFVAPYISFSGSPSMAWALLPVDRKGRWDLWMVWSHYAHKMSRRNDLQNGRGNPTEYRVFHKIARGQIWFVGSRST